MVFLSKEFRNTFILYIFFEKCHKHDESRMRVILMWLLGNLVSLMEVWLAKESVSLNW